MRRALALALLLAACGRSADDRPLDLSVIGRPPRLAERPGAPLAPPAALLTDAVAQGLVAFDAAGQLEPALAERWIVADGGRSFILRLAEARWANGRTVEAADVARRLRALTGPTSRNPLKSLTGAIDEIVAVTPRVIDIRLRSPRPNLLQLLAQPELAMIRGGGGSGPFVAAREGAVLVLRPRPAAGADPPPAPPPPLVRLHAERAALAVARFAAGQADGVLGGTFVDLPIARAARLPGTALRFDPVAGLFGLGFVATAPSRFTGDRATRRALAMAVDRDALVAAFAVPRWRIATRVVDGEVDDLPAVVAPDWADWPLVRRRAEARAVVARQTALEGPPVPLRVALPEGPGSRLLFARLAADWRAIGVSATAVKPRQPADLRLIDMVAAGDIASWYLRRFACELRVPCTQESDTALIAARNAPTLAERTVLLREADRLIAETVPFIPLARPLRWSLVGPRLTGWAPSARGLHPLRHLKAERRPR